MAIDLEAEMRNLLDRVDAEREVEETIEPCPICGSEMAPTNDGDDYYCANGNCPWVNVALPPSCHNVIARLLQTAVEYADEGNRHDFITAVLNFEALQKVAKGESE